MEKDNKIDKKPEGRKGGAVKWLLIIFAIAYLTALAFFSSCGSAHCDAYHQHNVFNSKAVIDTSRFKLKNYED